MKNNNSIIPRIWLLGGAIMAITSTSARADLFDDSQRGGRTEIYGLGEYLTGWQTTTFSSFGVSSKFSSGVGGGIGLGINLNSHFNLNTELAGAGLSLKGGNSAATISCDTTALQWRVGLDYNIFKTRLTPLVTASCGVLHFSGDFGDSRSRFSETDFSYGVGAGLRWDISDHWFAKAVYRVNWTSLKDSDGPTMFQSIGIGVGYSF